MFSFLIAIACLANLTQATPQVYGVPMLDGKIVGGEPTFIEKYPYQASLQFYSMHSCGAVVISENFVLTAAHCTNGFYASELVIRAGSTFHNSSGVVIQVAAIYQHPYYNFRLTDYDISVLRLASPLPFGSTIAPVALPEYNQPLPVGSVSQVSGWGLLKEDAIFGSGPTQLQVVEVPVVSLEECRAAYGANSITDRMVCAGLPEGGKDACKGDSGGPLVVNGTLIGLVSWSRGCARPGIPGVYASVPALRGYISYVTGF